MPFSAREAELIREIGEHNHVLENRLKYEEENRKKRKSRTRADTRPAADTCPDLKWIKIFKCV
jgi:hypothetical protein